MSQFDDQLPEDLRDIAARLSAARVTPTPLELDELSRRVHGRVGRARRSPQRRGFAGALRSKLVAVCLTLGLTLTTGVGVVLASDSFGGGGQNQFGNVWQTTSFRHDHDASYCQYHGPETYSYSFRTRHSFLTVFFVWDCRRLHVFFQCGEPFGFRWDGGGWNDTDLTSYDSYAPSEGSTLTITIDGVTYTLSPNGGPPSQGTTNPSYTVSFSANGVGATGSTAAETANVPTALSADGFSRPGYTFAGWNTSPTGGGTAYGAGATYPFTANATLYAQWTPNPKFTVTFSANGVGATGSTAAETANSPTALSADGFSRPGYTFAGWNTSPTGAGTAYGAGATYPFTANATLYAQWTPNPKFTVTFSANGVGATGSTAAETANVPTALSADGFSRPGYTFAGWNTSPTGGGTAYGAGATYAFTANAALYAQWTPVPQAPPSPPHWWQPPHHHH